MSFSSIRLMRLSQKMMEFLDSLVGPNKSLQLTAHHLGHIEHSTSPFVKNYGLLLEMDAQGEILQSWHSPNGALPKVTNF